MHSAFHLPVKSGFRSCKYKKPSDEICHMLRNKYHYLKVLMIDEILMIGRETFGHLNLALKAMLQNPLPCGGVALLVIGYFLQFPPVNQKYVFMKPSKRSYRSLNRWLWEMLQLH